MEGRKMRWEEVKSSPTDRTPSYKVNKLLVGAAEAI
jgi:hypothetical protein